MREPMAHLLVRAAKGPVVMVTVIATQGSTPREVGARMLVYAGGQDGSIGGGQLEFQESAAAEALLARDGEPWLRDVRRIVLGPDAGQCCGGVVEVLLERLTNEDVRALVTLDVVERPTVNGVPAREASGDFRHQPAIWVEQRDGQSWLLERTSPRLQPLYLYGAGHVARALVHVLRDLPFAVHWVEGDAARFPTTCDATHRISTASLDATAREAPAGAIHLVMTHAHDLDWEICDALLRRGDFAWLGLIGSATKRARFVQRFRRAGLSDDVLQRLDCPIGLVDVAGKAPAVIAVSVAAQLLSRSEWRRGRGTKM